MPDNITFEEFEKALLEAEETARETEWRGLTFREIMNVTGWGERKARRILRTLVEQGKANAVRGKQYNIAGQLGTTVRYVLKGTPK